MIGDSDGISSYLVGWRFNASNTKVDWQEVPNYGRINISGENEIGKTLAFGPNANKVIATDRIISANRRQLYIASLGSDSNVDPGWPVTYGSSTSAYSAADMIVLADGSIVTVATTLKNLVNKIALIKTGPNGEKGVWF